MDDIGRLDHVGLPLIVAFSSTQTKEGASDADYQHAMAVCNALHCELFKDFHQLYLKTDVLLADILEDFRITCTSYDQLDPANNISAPAISWDSML